MAKRSARRKVSFLLATTFAVGTGPAVIGAMAKDETPSAASDARAQAIRLDTITVESIDRSGNAGRATVKVTVAHNQ